MESITFTYKTDPSAGDIPAKVYYKAAQVSNGPKPIAIIFHAGGFVGGSIHMIPENQIKALAGMGCVVITPEYRLCPQVSVYEGPMADTKDAFRWAQTQLPSLLHEQCGVVVDGNRVVVMGHSAGGTLATHLGTVPNPPLAIANFYGPMNFEDSFWSKPLAAFAQIPNLPQEFLDKIYDGPVPFTATPMIVNGKPDLSSPRNAWLISHLRDGTHMREVTKDGDYRRIDPMAGLKEGFPPTCFVHGDADDFAPIEFSRTACEKLKSLGNETELIEVPGKPHVFDIALQREDVLFQDVVLKALKFLVRQASS